MSVSAQLAAELEAIEQSLEEGSNEVTRAVVSALEISPQSQASIELLLGEALGSCERRVRANAAAGLQAITLCSSPRTGRPLSISPRAFSLLVAALTVESDVSPRIEQLWALSRQEYRDGELAVYGPMVARILEAFVTTPAHVSEEILGQLVYAYERLRPSIDDTRLPAALEVWPRKLLGYAATGIPFILSDRANPKLVLIYNDNLDLWLPPGGHFNPGVEQTPGDALLEKISQETGASAIVIWNGQPFEGRDGKVEVCPAPSFVLLEDLASLSGRSKNEIHSHHYDLNYICQILDGQIDRIGQGSRPCLLVELRGLPPENRFEFVRDKIHEAATRHSHGCTEILDDVVERVVLSLEALGNAGERVLFSYRSPAGANGNGNGNGNGHTHIDSIQRVEGNLVVLGDNGYGHNHPD